MNSTVSKMSATRSTASRNARLEPALRHTLLRSLARDLSLPADHFAVTAAMDVLSTVSLERESFAVDRIPVRKIPQHLARVSIDTWCCVAACAAARVPRLAHG